MVARHPALAWSATTTSRPGGPESMTARASDPDTLVASAKAYLGALNKIVMKRQRDLPAAAAS